MDEGLMPAGHHQTDSTAPNVSLGEHGSLHHHVALKCTSPLTNVADGVWGKSKQKLAPHPPVLGWELCERRKPYRPRLHLPTFLRQDPPA